MKYKCGDQAIEVHGYLFDPGEKFTAPRDWKPSRGVIPLDEEAKIVYAEYHGEFLKEQARKKAKLTERAAAKKARIKEVLSKLPPEQTTAADEQPAEAKTGVLAPEEAPALLEEAPPAEESEEEHHGRKKKKGRASDEPPA